MYDGRGRGNTLIDWSVKSKNYKPVRGQSGKHENRRVATHLEGVGYKKSKFLGETAKLWRE